MICLDQFLHFMVGARPVGPSGPLRGEIGTKCVRLFVVLLGLACAPGHAATGIFVYKQTFSHPDGTASVLEYSAYQRIGAVTRFTLPSGQRTDITKFELVGIFPYVNPKAGTLRPAQLRQYDTILTQYKIVFDRFPYSRKYLRQQLELLREVVDHLKAGSAWHEGRWMPDAELNTLLEQVRKDAQKQLEREARQRAEEVKETALAAIRDRIAALEAESKLLAGRASQEDARSHALEQRLAELKEQAGQQIRSLTSESE